MNNVSPRGERRADIRAAINTVSLRCALSMSKVEESDLMEMFQNLVEYMPCDKAPDGMELDVEALERMTKGG